MRVFVSVVQSGSLSAAGRLLGLSPASVSRQLQSLEEGLGARLIHRTSRRLTLTEAGELYARQAEQILHQVEEANASVSSLELKPRGMLRVHSRMLVGQHYIVPALPRFLAEYPDVELDISLSNELVDLIERNVDIDIRIGKLEDSALMVRKLASSERIVCATPDYLARHPAPREPMELMRHNCLIYRVNMARTIWRFLDRDGALTEVPVHGSIRSDNGPAVVAAAKAGIGIALLPDWSIHRELADGRLVRLFASHTVSHTEFENGIYAVYLRTPHMPARLRAFLDFLVAQFREALPERPT
ncbi:LysR family transcriptional regulator [Roseomonas marmotae]|uniref:LysR family transcriptional regulator n=2 Tax=Roseomonas marmotae TaxID=2768161 RepID=A0ABS3KC58_9PROT|nr:LysR family transcriptional regulator [Roseomonas marmotae]MBO1075054.1 LysR family transcriptional regulator [Roseomonas marmotae]QTI80808.1 LysR family transcriptional regulator [Roseomonas marmotae]